MKKLISMFLVFIILIAQFGTTIATDYVTGGPEKQTLENYLIEHCVDLDQNNVLSDTEWASVKQLTLDDTINLNNIEKAVNLKSLWLVGLNLNKLDLSKLANLETLQLTSCQLNELNLSGLTHLKNLTFDAEKCNVMNLNQLTGLKDLAMWNASNLKEIGFSQLSSLETLNLIDCDLTGVDFSSLNKLKNLIITYSKMELPEQNLNLSSLTQLEKLSIYNYGSGIKQLDISKNNNLYSLDLGNTYDCDIKLPEDLSNITYATIASNQIKEIDLRNASNLYYASFSSSNNHWNQNNIKINNDNLYVIKEDNNWKIYQYEGNEIRIANSKEKIEADDIDYIFGGKIASENLTN